MCGESLGHRQATDFEAELVAALPRLRRFALTLTRRASDADDLVQMTCERAISNAHRRDPALELMPWLYVMTRNLWTSEMRKSRLRHGAGEVPADETDALITTATGEDEMRARQVLAAVLALPPGMSSVLLLVAVEGHSYAETATILDIPPGTVMSRVSAARARMRVLLAGGAV